MASDWYEQVSGRAIEQGDILANCPVFFVKSSAFPEEIAVGTNFPVEYEVTTYEVVVMSQSCDLQEGQGREKLQQVVLCPVQARSNLPDSHPLKRADALKAAAKGYQPSFFVLDRYEDPGQPLDRDVSIVHFNQVYTLPIEFVRALAERRSPRLRLKSPYREELSRRFGAFFGRIALDTQPRL